MLEISFDQGDDSDYDEEMTASRPSTCIYCKPAQYLPTDALNEADSDDDEEEDLLTHSDSEQDDGFVAQRVLSMRSKAKRRLRESGIGKHEKAMLDADLRQSYRHGDHQFKGLSLSSKKSTGGSEAAKRKDKNRRRLAIYSGLRKAIERNPSSYKLCDQCRAKLSEKSSTASSMDTTSGKTIKVDKTKTVYDEAEIDYINDN